MIYPVVVYLMDLAMGRSRELFCATVTSCGLLTVYSLPDGWPFVVRLAAMVAAQVAVGRALQRETA